MKRKQTIVEIYRSAKAADPSEDSQSLFKSIVHAEKSNNHSFFQSRSNKQSRDNSLLHDRNVGPSREPQNQLPIIIVQEKSPSAKPLSLFAHSKRSPDPHTLKPPAHQFNDISPVVSMKNVDISEADSDFTDSVKLMGPSVETSSLEAGKII